MVTTPQNLAANQLSEEAVRDLMILNEAFYAKFEAGDLHKQFKTIPVVHATSFHMWQYGNIKSSFLQRAHFIEAQARKNKKDVYRVESHQYIAESELEIDAYRDSAIFTATQRALKSQNFIQLIMVIEKRTVRRLWECLAYCDKADTIGAVTAKNPFGNSKHQMEFIKDNGLNSADIASKIASSDPLVVLEGAKLLPVVMETSALTLATGVGKNATKATEIKAEFVDATKFMADLLKLKSAVKRRTKMTFTKMDPEAFTVVRVPSGIYDALLAEKDLGNTLFTSANAHVRDMYPDSLTLHGFTIIEADEVFALYEQGDDDSASYHNIKVNYDANINDYSATVYGDGTKGSYPIAVTFTPRALVHAEIMPINFRTYKTENQQTTTAYFQESSDTLIVNPGHVAALMANPAK